MVCRSVGILEPDLDRKSANQSAGSRRGCAPLALRAARRLLWGVHSALAQYRVGNRNKRYNGWAVGVGASAGYSWMLHRRWNFSLEGGIGLYYMNDTRWNPAPPPGEDVFLRHYRRIALAPAKLEASFSYMF